MKKIAVMAAAAVMLAVGFVFAAADVDPDTWVAGYTNVTGVVAGSTNVVVIPAATFTANGATTNDLANSTGDIREVTKALLEELYASQSGLASTNTPAYMHVTKQQTINPGGQLTTKFTITFVSDLGSSSITSE